MKRNLTTVKTLLGLLVKWTVLAVLFLTILLIIWYITGSYRNFSDTSQLKTLNICLALSLLLVISSIYGTILHLYYAVSRKNRAHLRSVLGYVLIIALGSLVFLGSAFIIAAAGGNL